MASIGRGSHIQAPVPKLLHTNTPLTLSERDLVTKKVITVQEEFKKFARLDYVRGLDKREIPSTARPHLEFLHEHYRLLSVVHSVSEDILEQIFYQVVQLSGEGCDVWTLSQVSQRWREIAISSPRLWANIGNIVFKPLDLPPEQEARILRRLKLQIERAKTHPIAFKFTSGPAFETDHLLYKLASPHFPAIARILSFLSQFSNQWQDVELVVHERVMNGLTAVAGNLPVLRRLALEFLFHYDAVPLHHFLHAPQLRFVKASFPNDGRNLNAQVMLQLPWSQLRDYAEDINPEDLGVWPVLLESSRLETLDCSIRRIHPQPDHLVVKGSLTRLRLKFVMEGTSRMLRGLCLPSLVDLAVKTYHPSTIANDILFLIINSNCSLQGLSMGCKNENWDGFNPLPVLEVCPCLTKLKLNYLPNETIASLARRGTTGLNGPLLPGLRSLIVIVRLGYNPPDFNSIAVSDLAKCRGDMYKVGSAPRLDIVIKTKSFTFDDSLDVLSFLESFSVEPEGVLAKLRKWQEVLLGISSGFSASRWRALKPGYYAQVREIDSVFDEIEGYDLKGSNPALLYHLDIPALLHKVSADDAEHIPGNTIYSFSKRAKKVLESWKPILIRHAAKTRSWRRQGNQRISYIHKDSEERLDEGQVWEIVLGLC